MHASHLVKVFPPMRLSRTELDVTRRETCYVVIFISSSFFFFLCFSARMRVTRFQCSIDVSEFIVSHSQNRTPRVKIRFIRKQKFEDDFENKNIVRFYCRYYAINIDVFTIYICLAFFSKLPESFYFRMKNTRGEGYWL